MFMCIFYDITKKVLRVQQFFPKAKNEGVKNCTQSVCLYSGEQGE